MSKSNRLLWPKPVLGMFHKQMTSELGTSEITVKIHREEGLEFYERVSGARLGDQMGKPARPFLVHTEEVNYASS